MKQHPQRLSRSFVDRVQEPGRYGDGRGGFGLTLIVRPRAGGGLRKSWAQRLTVDGKAVDIGLGPYPVVALSEAREAALANRRAVWNGQDPRRSKDARVPTFAEAAEKVIQLHETSWKPGTNLASQWRRTLRDYAKPIASKRIDSISSADVLSVLVPVWNVKRATARQVRQRISAVMKWAIAEGLRSDNPAGEAIQAVLPRNGQRVKHHKALHYEEIVGAITDVYEVNVGGSKAAKVALEFLVLTATRGSEVRNARWDEIDLESKTWTIPPERMKTGVEHRVPLSTGALFVLKLAEADLKDSSGLIFPSTHHGKVLSEPTLGRLLSRSGVDCVPHGFRSSFRDWASEYGANGEVAEAALAHVVKNPVEAAYRRTDLYDARVTLMQDWSDYLGYGSEQVLLPRMEPDPTYRDYLHREILNEYMGPEFYETDENSTDEKPMKVQEVEVQQ